uniref:Uncharacterized protein n=1 Tax=Ananas comosus var. bracteatus TaxID=296719 RepID=A0A6V7QRX6_ANACO
MKASIKFREEKNPLVRTKVPISVLGLPLVSGLAVGDTGELRVDLATAFDFGPSLRVSYRPTDPWRPFSLVLKTRPSAAAPMAMTAEFSPLGRGGAGPSFSVLFKPRFGDFAITKSFRSSSSPVALGRLRTVREQASCRSSTTSHLRTGSVPIPVRRQSVSFRPTIGAAVLAGSADCFLEWRLSREASSRCGGRLH